MRIGIDARLIDETGVGRYIRNLIAELAARDFSHEFVVFLRKNQFDTFSLPNARWRKVLADVPWHSMTEQIVMPGIFFQANLSLLHVPYFNVPIFYPGRIVVTIHDLTILHMDTGRATTLPWILYKLKRLGYRMLVWWAVHRSKQIITVSEATKRDIVKSFDIDPARIHVTYEGVDSHIRVPSRKKVAMPMTGAYLLYVGNAYPHKNLESLIAALPRVHAQAKLVIVGREDFFLQRIKQTVREKNLSHRVVFLGPVSDEQLASLYIHAKAFVFPSFMEGFGLPALEALSFGCPVLCSDIAIFHEILGSRATYFDPYNPNDIAKVINTQTSRKTPYLDTRFQWSRMAEKTVHIYESSARI
jgi:glycosyltransferase involved in cell wall biosynthesis